MKELNAKAKKDNLVMKLLKVSSISHPIAQTSKGPLSLMLPFEGTGSDYKFVLDAVPVSEEENRALMNILKDVIVK